MFPMLCPWAEHGCTRARADGAPSTAVFPNFNTMEGPYLPTLVPSDDAVSRHKVAPLEEKTPFPGTLRGLRSRIEPISCLRLGQARLCYQNNG